MLLLREISNEIRSGEDEFHWHNYNFKVPGGNTVFWVTVRLEEYIRDGESISLDDRLRLKLNNQQMGYLKGSDTGTISKTWVFEETLPSGAHDLDVFGQISPLFYDVTVLGGPSGGVIFDQEYDETAPGGSDVLWKEITFPTWGGRVAVYVSGTADEDANPQPRNRYGYQYSNFRDDYDDDLRIVLNDIDYGWQTEKSLYGNRLFGDPKSILITENLEMGWHTLRVYTNNTPTLYRILIYGQNDDTPLPVTLSNFDVAVRESQNLIQWRTESEINNLGFNLYRAQNPTDQPVSELDFARINHQLIPGAGNTNLPKEYSFVDEDVQNDRFYWYQLEDIDYNGNGTRHQPVKVYRPEYVVDQFQLFQNYPNPFNNSTIIKVAIPENMNGKIHVVDLQGSLVKSLHEGTFERGINAFSWDGRNEKNLQVGSGLYFCSFVSEEFRHTIKMLHIR